MKKKFTAFLIICVLVLGTTLSVFATNTTQPLAIESIDAPLSDVDNAPSPRGCSWCGGPDGWWFCLCWVLG